MASSVSLPLSTAGTIGVDVNGVEHRFNIIANSINQLGMSYMSRHTDVIYDCKTKLLPKEMVVEKTCYVFIKIRLMIL